MRSCLVAYVKNFEERRVRHICKKAKLEIRALIKNFCKKGMPHKEIHEDFIEILWKKSPSYSTVKKCAAELKRGERALMMMDGLAAQKDATADMKMSWSCTHPGYV